MARFRYHDSTTSPLYVELGWQGLSYRKNRIRVDLTEKLNECEFSINEQLGHFLHDPKTAKQGYKMMSSQLGEITIKFAIKFLIISEIQVFVNGKKIPGSELIDYRGTGQVGKHT